MDALNRLFDQNRQWAHSVSSRDPGFFRRLSRQQHPEYLWIGCSDSRVSANQILGLPPGEVFVHRNMANVVSRQDLNCMSVIQYAVDVLKVQHILVVGHYGCGGVKATLQGDRVGLADQWLRHVEEVKDRHRDCLSCLSDFEARHDRLCELNVIEQVAHVCQSDMVQAAWGRGQFLAVHGCIYDIRDGLLQDLEVSVLCAKEASATYANAIAQRCP